MSNKKYSAIQIKDKEQKEVLRIETNGDIFWLKNGKMTKVKMDKELSLAFSYCVTVMSGMSPDKLIEKIKTHQ